jgi:hypothetical protein
MTEDQKETSVKVTQMVSQTKENKVVVQEGSRLWPFNL